MEIIRSVKSLDTAVEAARQEGKSIGLVPTMGALHAGHRSLVERARSENDIVIVSVLSILRNSIIPTTSAHIRAQRKPTAVCSKSVAWT